MRVVFLLGFFIVFTATAKPIKNGFDLQGSIIPVEEVLSGGPPRDGIPAIDKPKFIAASEANFLKSDDRVIGVNYKGVSRAYPIRILNWHEIVNDRIADKSVIVTFCPLCGTGMVFSGEFNNQSHQFGVSGLLYNNDVLLYDRETETLWSQILSKGVSGKLVNQTLTIIPSSHTSWRSWLKQHPKTQVLSTDTGIKRDYSRSPYGDYSKNSSTYFPVAFRSKKYHPKERVLGIMLNGQYKVYPFSELAKLGSNSLTDSFSGAQLTIEFDIENREGVIKNKAGEILPTVNSFWFAWYAFHPNTKIHTQ